MICHSSDEVLAEIRKHMYVNNITAKELAFRMNKTPQSISQMFNVGNPRLNTLFEVCDALGLDIDFSLIRVR